MHFLFWHSFPNHLFCNLFSKKKKRRKKIWVILIIWSDNDVTESKIILLWNSRRLFSLWPQSTGANYHRVMCKVSLRASKNLMRTLCGLWRKSSNFTELQGTVEVFRPWCSQYLLDFFRDNIQKNLYLV